MRRAALLLAASLLVGCVRQAVLENDVQSAEWKARTLRTATDLSLAHAALSSQLVELEALYQRDPGDRRIRGLLERGYLLMARGFVELRRLEASASGDVPRVEQEAQLQADAARRAAYYAVEKGAPVELGFERALREADEACRNRDRAAYDRRLDRALASKETSAEGRLEHALLRRLAALWLAPNVAARCGFGAGS